MNVYISGSLAGSKDIVKARALYEHLAQTCRQANCTPYVPHQNTDPIWSMELDCTAVYDKDIERLSAADVIVAYLGEPSLGVGAEIAFAVQMKKHIIAIWEEDAKVSRFVAGLLHRYSLAHVATFPDTGQADAFILLTLTDLQYGSRGSCQTFADAVSNRVAVD